MDRDRGRASVAFDPHVGALLTNAATARRKTAEQSLARHRDCIGARLRVSSGIDRCVATGGHDSPGVRALVPSRGPGRTSDEEALLAMDREREVEAVDLARKLSVATREPVRETVLRPAWSHDEVVGSSPGPIQQ